MNDVLKGMLFVLIVLYVISPDVLPGPIDDIIVAVGGIAIQKRLEGRCTKSNYCKYA